MSSEPPALEPPTVANKDRRPNGTSDEPAARIPLEDWTIAQWLHQLTPGHVVAVIGAVVTLITASVAFGAYIQPWVTALLERPRGCDDMSGYPLGRWITHGVKVRTGRVDMTFGDELGSFTGPKQGIWFAGLGKEDPLSGSYPEMKREQFTSDMAPAPGRLIQIRHISPSEDYHDLSSLHVSADGCTMVGDFTGTLKGKVFVEGYAAYCWQFAPRCEFSLEGEGWRRPNVRREQQAVMQEEP